MEDKKALLKGTDADPFPKMVVDETDDTHIEEVRQKSLYNQNCKARCDNNQFFEKRSNPLSSKGN